MRREHAIKIIATGVVLLFAIGCGGGSGSHVNSVVTSGSNVQPITVNSGPAGNYTNGVFTSLTVCVPGSSTCQTIDGVLVDTGSSGLRLLSSALTVTLPQQKAPDGNAVVECLPFVSGHTWGPVQTADIQISGEKASAIPIQVMSDTDFSAPLNCSDQGPSEDTITSLGANGILGVGNFAQDCGSACATAGASNPGLYYECPSSGCVVVGESLSQQVQNPVALFPTDNNGVIIELPAVTAPQATVSGSLVFGIGTQSNNGLNGATVFALNQNGNFTTSFNNQSYNQSFLDSGSNGLYFLSSSATGIPDCPDAPFFYCPSGTKNLTATNQGSNGTSAPVKFSVANADNLFNSNPSAFVFVELAGPNSLDGFDWGLPFFFGRNVYTAIEGRSTPGTPGTPAGAGPFWAY